MAACSKPSYLFDLDDHPWKAESAAIFHRAWKLAEAEPRYAAQKTAWKAKYG